MPGTHRCGRIDHVMVGSQQGADLKRVELLKQRFPVTPVELNQGYYLNGLCLDLLILELSSYVSEITNDEFTALSQNLIGWSTLSQNLIGCSILSQEFCNTY